MTRDLPRQQAAKIDECLYKTAEICGPPLAARRAEARGRPRHGRDPSAGRGSRSAAACTRFRHCSPAVRRRCSPSPRSARSATSRCWTALTTKSSSAICTSTTSRPTRWARRKPSARPRPPRDRPRRAGGARAAAGDPAGGGIPVRAAPGVGGAFLQRFDLPGFHLRLYAGADGCRCADQSAGCRYFLRPDYRGRPLDDHGRHPGPGGFLRRHGLQGGRYAHRASPPSRWI